MFIPDKIALQGVQSVYKLNLNFKQIMGIDFIIEIFALLLAISVHESAHAFAAWKLGDPTAKNAGRISLNPLRHLDPMGLIMMLTVHIGWGKPVPVSVWRLGKPKRDEALTALAGPVSNILLAVILAMPLKYMGNYLPEWALSVLGVVMATNIVLFAFNMLPFPPLDGSKFIGMIVPRRFEGIYRRYLEKGMVWFMIFLLLDQFVLVKILGWSFLSEFIGLVYTLITGVIFLGS